MPDRVSCSRLSINLPDSVVFGRFLMKTIDETPDEELRKRGLVLSNRKLKVEITKIREETEKIHKRYLLDLWKVLISAAVAAVSIFKVLEKLI